MPFMKDLSVFPFGGFVVNINSCTVAHYDDFDGEDLCVLLFFGDWEDGEIVLYQAGIAFKVKRGDVLAFPSSRIIHFNLHYKGERYSLVFATDKTYISWLEDRNGWKDVVN